MTKTTPRNKGPEGRRRFVEKQSGNTSVRFFLSFQGLTQLSPQQAMFTYTQATKQKKHLILRIFCLFLVLGLYTHTTSGFYMDARDLNSGPREDFQSQERPRNKTLILPGMVTHAYRHSTWEPRDRFKSSLSCSKTLTQKEKEGWVYSYW